MPVSSIRVCTIVHGLFALTHLHNRTIRKRR
nr:MAG TPA: hypothetical protein [Caudoviricetes sp.]